MDRTCTSVLCHQCDLCIILYKQGDYIGWNNIIPLGRAYKQSFIDLYAEYLIQ